MGQLIDIRMPAEQQEGTQSVVGRWVKQVGEFVRQHDPLIEISTDKVSVEIPAPISGVVSEILKKENDPVLPGELLGRMEERAADAPLQQPPSAPIQHQGTSAGRGSGAAAAGLSPAVRKLLQKYGISAEGIPGSGVGGRITVEDVERFVAGKSGAGSKVAPVSGRKIPHSVMRKQIATHMVTSLLHTAPHVTSVFEADMSAVIRHREANKAEFSSKGAHLTFTAYFVWASARALLAVPEVNSRWHDDGLEVFDSCHIGVGTALEDGGLIVPVIRDAERCTLFELASQLQDLTSRARSGALQPKDVQGATFSISNHGVSGSLFAAPIIIPQPQSAILGVGKLEKRPVVIEQGGREEISIQPRLYVTLTIDHRVIDGFLANRFLATFVEALQTPG